MGVAEARAGTHVEVRRVRAVHTAVAGRARFRVEGLHSSGDFGRRLEERFRVLGGFSYVSANALTGNVLLRYNSGRTAEDVAELLEAVVAELFAGSSVPACARTQAEPPRTRGPAPGPAAAEPQPEAVWHGKGRKEVLRELGSTKLTGLTEEAWREKWERYGANLLPESVPRSGLSIFLGQFRSTPVALLGGAAVLSAATGGLADAVVILGVVVLNAAIGYATESQSERVIHSLKRLVRPTAAVVRGGSVCELPAEEVVPGDILVLRPGSYVAADARVLEANRLTIDESALTGESMPVAKNCRRLLDAQVPLADRSNMVHMGTLVTGGQGLAAVVATGRFTEMGRIQVLVGEAESPETPMERQLRLMGNQLVLVLGAVCAGVFGIGLLRGYGFLEMVRSAISLAVAAVPEGLPTVATTTLALGIRNMRRKNVLIRKLDAVETLGSVQTLCLDKTGTLTANRMSLQAAFVGGERLRVQEGRFFGETGEVNPYAREDLLRLLHVGVLCSETELVREGGAYVLQGSPTENALVETAIACGVDVPELRARLPSVAVNLRSEERPFMWTLHAAESGRRFVAVKGSPSEVLALCTHWDRQGEVRPLTDEELLSIELENERMGGIALRVLGFAYGWTQDGEAPVDTPSRLTWLGLVGMADPLRPGVKRVIGELQRAGLDAVMITGDQAQTAQTIGRELDLGAGRELKILDSSAIAALEQEVTEALFQRVDVFARVSPANKLQIVQALQRAGKVVAMTGDGINDGPALKAADIGVAMGHTGTDVAREVADVVLEDDRLETMIVAVSQGRTIYNNIRKSTHFLLATNLSEIVVMSGALAGGLGQPLTARQLLWINLVTDVFPGLALALEPPEPDVLDRPPRDPKQPIMGKGDLLRIGFESLVLSGGALAAYGIGLARYGRGPKAGSLAFTTLTSGQLLHALSCRSEDKRLFARSSLRPNPYLRWAMAGSLALQAATLAVPGLRSLLGLAPLGLADLAIVAAGAVGPLLVNEATKPSRSTPRLAPAKGDA
ncbi:MAG: cation-transporting P-type ATPase [Deltaproteobacteria bacterium]|nr:cation-transporting P-type ATPase [Deltaproteobacteria bacterium]